MWVEYIRSLYPKANIRFDEKIKCPCVDMDSKTIKIPMGFPEGVMTRAVVKHELGHLLFTEKAYDDVVKEEHIEKNDASFLLSNSIEDIRSEKRFGTDYIGVKQDFEEMSKEVFSKIEHIPYSLTGLAFLTSYYLNFGALPDTEIDNKLLDFFDKEKNEIYTKFLGLKDVNGSVRLAEYILDKWEKEFGKQPERSQYSQEKSQGKGEGKGEGKEGESKKGEGESGSKAKAEGGKGEVKEGEGKATGEKAKVWGDDKLEQGTSSIHELVKDFIKANIKGHSFSADYQKYSNCGENFIYEKEQLARQFSSCGQMEVSGIDGQVLKIRQTLLGWLVDEARNRTLRLTKSGKLSSRDLFRVKTEKEPKVFKKRIFGKSNSVDLEILIDHSGSMKNYGIPLALKMGYIFNKALKSIKQVNYEITGFTTKGFHTRGIHGLDNVYFVYKRFGEKSNALTEKLLLTDLEDSYNLLCHNNDYDAICYGEKQLAKQSNNRKIMFVISDGRPEVNFVSSSVLNTMTRDKIKDLRKKGYEVYGFGICVNLKDLYEKNFVAVENISELAKIVSTKLLSVIQK